MTSDHPTDSGGDDESVQYFVSHHDEIVRGAGHTRLLVAALGLAFLLLLTLFAISGAIGGARAAAESSRIQRHGIRLPATVLSVRTTKHTHTSWSRWSFVGTTFTTYHSVLSVQLARTVESRSTAAINSPDDHPAQPGQPLDVLLDPHDLSTGELPGHPVEPAHGWLLVAAFAAGLVAADGCVAFAIFTAAARRRSQPEPGA